MAFVLLDGVLSRDIRLPQPRGAGFQSLDDGQAMSHGLDQIPTLEGRTLLYYGV